MAAIQTPTLPESVADAVVATWHKQVGDAVQQGEKLVDIETDKIVIEVEAAEDGVLASINAEAGSTITSGTILGEIGAIDAKTAQESAATPAPPKVAVPPAAAPAAPATAPAVPAAPMPAGASASGYTSSPGPTETTAVSDLSPAARRKLQEGQEPQISAASPPAAAPTTAPPVAAQLKASTTPLAAATGSLPGERQQRREPMSRLRVRIAERLLQAQQTAAILTTFNEVDMYQVMTLRSRYQEKFSKQYAIKLGLMSFFVKAAVAALQRFPVVNAALDAQDIIYHDYCDIGIAVASPRGLVVPILRNCENLSMAEIENQIKDFGERAKSGSIKLEELSGGTFTISNGGIFGSLLSTPILNPPQSAILGIHKIESRAVVVEDKVVIRPMMYLALSYDHRIIDGSDSVQCLVAIKEYLEDPARLALAL